MTATDTGPTPRPPGDEALDETPTEIAAGLSTQPTPDSVPPGVRLGLVGTLRWLWRQLTSMRTALILLFLLALGSVPGSVFPQRSIDALKVRDYLAANPTWGPVLDRLGMFDVFAAPWFAAIYLLLFVSLVGCVLPRTRLHLAAMRAAPPAAPRRLRRMPEWRGWQAHGPAADVGPEVLSASAQHLRASRWRVTQQAYDPDRGTGWVAAEKGYARETGNLLFHIALVVLLVAVGYGALWGWKGNVIVREGQGFANTLTQYDAWAGGRFVDPANLAPFSFTLDSFEADFERGAAQRGAPRVFEAAVTYRATPQSEPQQTTVEVNSPLAVEGAKAFLVGHGYAPHFVIKDAGGRVTFDDSVPFLPQDGNFTSTGVVKAPDATPQVGLQGIFLPTAVVDQVRGPHSIFPAPDDPMVFLSAWQGDLGLGSGAPQSVYKLDVAQMSKLGLEALAPGQSWTLPQGAGTVTFTGFERWATFQIAYDPGKELALAAAVVALIGLSLSLSIRRRRVWVRVSRAHDAPGTATLVEVAGLSRTETGGLPVEVDELSAAVRSAAPPVVADGVSDPGAAMDTLAPPPAPSDPTGRPVQKG